MEAEMNAVRQLNNTAVANLAAGNLDTAVSLLHLALEDLREDLGQRALAGGSVARSILNPTTVQLHPSLCKFDFCFSPNSAFYVYKKAFSIPETEMDADGIAIILIYNYGLALQRRGLLRGEDLSLRKAKKMYAMSLDLAELMEHNGRGLSQVLAMALCNNLGHLHSHFLETAEVRQCREKLRISLSRSDRKRSSCRTERRPFVFSSNNSFP